MSQAGLLKLGSGNGKGKEKEKEPVWDGFMFEVPGFHDEVFWDWKDVITASEMQILKRLGFQMQVSQSVHRRQAISLLDGTWSMDTPGRRWSREGNRWVVKADNRWTSHIVM
jgi:hypothetical protein